MVSERVDRQAHGILKVCSRICRCICRDICYLILVERANALSLCPGLIRLTAATAPVVLPQLEFGEGEAGASISVNIDPLEVVEESSGELCKISPLCSVYMNIMVVDLPARFFFLKRNLLIAQQASFFILIFCPND